MFFFFFQNFFWTGQIWNTDSGHNLAHGRDQLLFHGHGSSPLEPAILLKPFQFSIAVTIMTIFATFEKKSLYFCDIWIIWVVESIATIVVAIDSVTEAVQNLIISHTRCWIPIVVLTR